MPNRRTLLKQALGGTVVLLGPHELAWGAKLLAVRIWPANDYTRVTLESDTQLDATFFAIDNPNRLVIDIEGLELSPQLRDLMRKVRADDPYIAGVRIGQNRPKVARLVIDLKQQVKPQVFALAPVAAYQHRMVFDLYPAQTPDPKLAMPLPAAAASGPRASASAVPNANHASSPQAASGAAASSGAGASAHASEAMNDVLEDFLGGLKRPPSGTDSKAIKGSPTVADKTLDKANEGRTTRNESASDKSDKSANTQRLVIVALDAGHGGEDPGAIGPSGLFEKTVVLAVAYKLRELINAQPGMRAMMTRESDYFVPLYDRVAKARRVQADLFVSIHADAFMNPQAHGASVFALSENGATSAAARWMAKKENASDMVGGVNINAKDATVMRTLLDMSTTAQIKDSLKLGSAVLGHLSKIGRLHKARVEQAGFAVLKAPDIPSILVETGFISNPQEESKLQDHDYQQQLADALLAGIQRYFARNPPLARNRSM